MKISNVLTKLGPFLALIVVIAIFGILEPAKFFSIINIGNIINQTVVTAIAAIGMTYIIVSAGIDLSVGSVVAFTGVLSTMFIVWASPSMPVMLVIPLGVLVGILCGGLCGAFNGFVITKGKMPPFIVTLGMLEMMRGASYVVSGGLPVTNLPKMFSAMGNNYQYSIVFLIVIAIILTFVLRKTVFGVQVYAVGSNENTARLCGVKVDRTKLFVYIIGGMTAGLAGVLQASRLSTGQPSTGIGFELDVIAAVVVGGGSLMGGEGTITGSIIGAFIIKILRNGCNLVGISPYVQRIIIGLIIIIAVFVDQLRRKQSQTRNA